MSDAQQALARRLRRQALACGRLGSPLYGDLLERLAKDTESGGPAWKLLEGHERDPPGSALALRLMGAVHRLVLAGELAALGAHYPSVGGDGDPEGCWIALREALADRAAELREFVRSPVQTNEVGRSAALVGGFLEIAALTGLPLRLLEAGASAGLNLRFDRYFYATEHSSWGSADSPVRFQGIYEGQPPFEQRLEIDSRQGCDTHALDPNAAADRLTLRSYVWPDQPKRLGDLERALEIASTVSAPVMRADAVSWVEHQLSEPRTGVVRVLFHSIFAQYLSAEDRRRLLGVLGQAAERTSADGPLAWLRMEPEPVSGARAEVRLTLWPHGVDRRLAFSGYHGERISWL
ncbi:MAG TPA: DUF2332 domain-containing protein [Solirubrobacteraceae bacterium]